MGAERDGAALRLFRRERHTPRAAGPAVYIGVFDPDKFRVALIDKQPQLGAGAAGVDARRPAPGARRCLLPAPRAVRPPANRAQARAHGTHQPGCARRGWHSHAVCHGGPGRERGSGSGTGAAGSCSRERDNSLSARMPSHAPVNDLYGRLFATWTLLTCGLCLLCARTPTNPAIYGA